MDYYRSGNLLWCVSQAMALAIPAAVLFTGLSAGMRDLARRVGRKWFFTVAIYFVLYALLNYVLHFPLAYYAGFVRQHAYGLSNQSFARWLVESLLDWARRWSSAPWQSGFLIGFCGAARGVGGSIRLWRRCR